MSHGILAPEWDEAARHLVRAHGADPNRLLSLGVPVNQLKWVHFDTHAALEIVGLQPPDGHVHRELPDPNLDPQGDRSDPRFKPFRSAPSGPKAAPTSTASYYAEYTDTGLPQTGMSPWWERDVTGRWASMAVEELGEYFSDGCPEYEFGRSETYCKLHEHFAAHGQRVVTADQAVAEFREGIRRQAAAVAFRFQVKASLPAVIGRSGPAMTLAEPRDRELREVPATDQAIRAPRPISDRKLP